MEYLKFRSSAVDSAACRSRPPVAAAPAVSDYSLADWLADYRDWHESHRLNNVLF